MILNTREQQELTELLEKMIAAKSYSGHEEGMSALMLEFMRNNGFDEAFIDDYGNVLGCIRGRKPGKTILFDGHIDTVPAENREAWSLDPFKAEIRGGRIYGRGASDMKGADAAFLTAIARFAKDTGKHFAGEIWAAGIVHEECFEGVASRAVSERVKPDVVIIGESSEMNIKCSQRGRAEIVLETFGVPCHSSNPQKGVNAVYSMMKAVEAFRSLPKVSCEGMYGDGILELTDIHSEPYPGASVVPHYCRVTFDRRTMPGETRESVLAPLQTALDELAAEDPNFKAKVFFPRGSERCSTGKLIEADRFFPAWKEPEDREEITAVWNAVRAMDYKPRLTGYSFCTNGSHYDGEKGILCIGMGPGREEYAHITDEFIELKDLFEITDYYYAACRALTESQ